MTNTKSCPTNNTFFLCAAGGREKDGLPHKILCRTAGSSTNAALYRPAHTRFLGDCRNYVFYNLLENERKVGKMSGF